MKNVALHNLGCKVNSYEMEVIQQMLQQNGYHIVPFDGPADIYIVNTCTVTNIADRKSRQLLHRARARNPAAVVVAIGCYVRPGQEMDDSVDLAVGNGDKKNLLPILEAYLAKRKGGEAPFPGAAKGDDDIRRYGGEFPLLRRTGGHTRAYLKIQDGCNQFCSYCIIPYARGRVRSREEADILKEIEGLAQAGCQEVVLTGIHISSYGMDLENRPKLVDLAEKIQRIEPLKRIRFGSLEPRIISAECVERLSKLSKLCPHFHLSLQSGCDETLKRMNRQYTTGEYFQSMEALRRTYGQPAVTTDIIVGFPGETEEEFQETKRFLEEGDFYEIHVFQYSKRRGTRAADLPEQIPEPVKAARSKELLALTRRQSAAFRSRYIGRNVQVLWEEEKTIQGKNYLLGHTADYVRAAMECGRHGEKEGEEDGVSGRAARTNCLQEVRVTGFLTDEILMGAAVLAPP
ncbi:MAG: tRNA (N(6)-L-threonylcarbamoyladenosine(37)-C(2))-methylthiotransferase MtaB [Clostridium sp.]|nr:tRNA (N(6)-L-threonylcarbamoyladenosine(37)-C(2))-methylthiotransferase MtaB [Clostridium sp.]